MAPAASWVTWTQLHTIITAAISNYQSRLIKPACFTLHNGAIISFLHLSVSLKQFIFQWNRCMPAGGRKNRLACFFGWSHSQWLWVHFFFHRCGMQDLLRIRSEVSPHLPVISWRVFESSVVKSYWGFCEEQTHHQIPQFYMGLSPFRWPSAPAEASGCLNLSVWEICCVRYVVLGAQVRQ